MDSFDDKKLRVSRLLDLINSKDAIAQHKERGNAGLSAVEQYTELKQRYEKELLEILTTEMGIRIPVAA